MIIKVGRRKYYKFIFKFGHYPVIDNRNFCFWWCKNFILIKSFSIVSTTAWDQMIQNKLFVACVGIITFLQSKHERSCCQKSVGNWIWRSLLLATIWQSFCANSIIIDTNSVQMQCNYFPFSINVWTTLLSKTFKELIFKSLITCNKQIRIQSSAGCKDTVLP